jgi:hypothetical protein
MAGAVTIIGGTGDEARVRITGPPGRAWQGR